MLKELQKKRSDLKDISEESKEKRNTLNAEASALAAKRNDLNKKTKDLINEAQELKPRNLKYSGMRSTRRSVNTRTSAMIPTPKQTSSLQRQIPSGSRTTSVGPQSKP